MVVQAVSSSSKADGRATGSSSSSVISFPANKSESAASASASSASHTTSARNNNISRATLSQLFARSRRWWRKLNDKEIFGRRAKLSHLIHAFKMGVYLKIGITLLLLLRLASHSSQMTFPRGAISRGEHYHALSSAKNTPSMRIIVLASHGSPSKLQALLESLERANYVSEDAVALDIWLHTSSYANALPFIVYPVAVAIFGPPRFDHATAAVAATFQWTKGKKSVIAVRSETEWSSTWLATPATANDTILFVDAARASLLSSNFVSWLRRAHMRRADIAAYALDSLAITSSSIADSEQHTGELAYDRRTGNSIVAEAFFPATAVFSPVTDVWITFLQWHKIRKTRWLNHPRIHRRLRLGGFDKWDALLMDPLRAWFSQFCEEYRARIVHPVLPDDRVLVVRREGTTDPRIVSGAGLVPMKEYTSSVHLSVSAENPSRVHNEESPTFVLAAEHSLPVLKWDGQRDILSHAFGCAAKRSSSSKTVRKFSRDIVREFTFRDVFGAEAEAHHLEVVNSVEKHGWKTGGSEIHITSVSTEADLYNAMNWLCNVAAVRIIPRCLVIFARGEDLSRRMEEYIERLNRHRYPASRPLVLSLASADDQQGPSAGRHFADSENYSRDEMLFVLEKYLVIHEIISRGLNVVLFEPDQLWFSSPEPYIHNVLISSKFADGTVAEREYDADGKAPEFIAAHNSGGEVSPSFVYIRATLTTRQVWCETGAMLNSIYLSKIDSMQKGNRFRSKGSSGFCEQHQMNVILAHRMRSLHRRRPRPRISGLDPDLFADASRLMQIGVEAHSQASRTGSGATPAMGLKRAPVVANVHDGCDKDEIASWNSRARKGGFWFVDSSQMCVLEAVQKTINRQVT